MLRRLRPLFSEHLPWSALLVGSLTCAAAILLLAGWGIMVWVALALALALAVGLVVRRLRTSVRRPDRLGVPPDAPHPAPVSTGER